MVRSRGETNGRFVCFIAALFFIASAFTSLHHLWFLQTAEVVDGSVVSCRQELIQNRGGHHVSRVVTVEFFDTRDVRYHFESSIGTEESITVGSSLPILYQRGNPANAYVGGEFFRSLPLALAALGVFFAVCGFCLIAISKWISGSEVLNPCVE